MSGRLIRVSLIFFGLVCVSAVLIQLCQNNAAKIASDQLVIGNLYDVTVRRQGIEQLFDGLLVKVTKDWIVLGKILEETYEENDDQPGLKDIPWIGQWLEKPTPMLRSYKSYCWIPRSVAHVQASPAEIAPDVLHAFEHDDPTLDGKCFVSYIADHQQADADGELLSLKDGQLVLNTEYEKTREAASSWSNLPLVGRFFTQYKIVTTTVKREIALNDVLAIETEKEPATPSVEMADSIEPQRRRDAEKPAIISRK